MNRAHEFVPKPLVEELRRVAVAFPRPWFDIRMLERPRFAVQPLFDSPFLRRVTRGGTGTDWAGVAVLLEWVGGGPKVVRLTQEQFDAMGQVAVNLEVRDYAQPFDALMVAFPPGGRFRSCCCWRHGEDMVFLQLMTHDGSHDIVTAFRHWDGERMERSLSVYEESLRSVQAEAQHAQRVALNACLLLSMHPFSARPALSKEAASDARLATERTERGERARERLHTALTVVEFDRSVVLRDVERSDGGVGTGEERGCHWRRGHVRMQPYGERSALRKRVFIRPVLVRADRFGGELPDASAEYGVR